jgi:hypothetical protein
LDAIGKRGTVPAYPKGHPIKLTKQQIAHFKTFGYLIRRQVFPPDELAAIVRAAEDRWRQMETAGKVEVGNFIEPCPQLVYLADDDRIYEPVSQLLGPGFIWGGSEGNRREHRELDDHIWHSDRDAVNGMTFGCIKHMIYFEPTTKDTGALRIVPGSHHQAFAELLDPLNEQRPDTCRRLFGVEGGELPCVPLESEPGDLVMFSQYLFHGVYQKQATRRYIALKFAEKPTAPAHFELLNKYTPDRSTLHESFLSSERPRIREMIENIHESWMRGS